MLYERQGARARARPRGARNSVATPLESPPFTFYVSLLLPREIYCQTWILSSRLEKLFRGYVFRVFCFFLNFDVFFLFAYVLSLELEFVDIHFANESAILSDICCLIDLLSLTFVIQRRLNFW